LRFWTTGPEFTTASHSGRHCRGTPAQEQVEVEIDKRWL
jgi:hypothetical protein